MLKQILDNRILLLYVIPFSLGVLSVFSFQPFNLSVLNFFILPALFFIIVNVSKRSKSRYRKKPYFKNLFSIGLFFGYGFYLSGIFWITYSLTFDENFKFLIPFALILIPLFLSLFYGIWVVLIGKFLNYNLHSIILFSGSLAFTDYVKGKILTGFPWNLWSYSWSWFTEILQILNLTGLYAFNLIAITIYTIPAILLLKNKFSKKILVLSITFLIIFSSYIYGTVTLNKNKALLNYIDGNNKVYVKVVSPNFKLKYNISSLEIEEKLKKLIKYSDPDPDKETLFIWPEGIFTGFYFDEILKYKDLIKNEFNNKDLILFGINTIGKNSNKYFNSLIIINNDLEILYTYNKRKLVPFGEFLPFENLLSNFGLRKITEGHSSFSTGDSQKNFIFNKTNILPLICYEIIFPELIQKSEKETNLIINISEDGWFGESIGPKQHFAKAIFRSIESNSFLLRSANKGVSAIISNKGEIIKKLNTNEAGNIEMDIPLINSEYKNKNDLIFFFLLFTYLIIFLIFNNKVYAK